MGKILKSVLIIICLFSTSSCNTQGDISPYVGIYKVTDSYEKEIHYFWTEETVLKNESLGLSQYQIEIKEDYTVLATLVDHPTYYGTVNIRGDHLNFVGLPFDKNFNFELYKPYNITYLKYQYDTTKPLVDYNYTKREIILERNLNINDLIGSYEFIYTYTDEFRKKVGEEEFILLNSRYDLGLVGKKITIDSSYKAKIIPLDYEEAEVSLVDNKISFDGFSYFDKNCEFEIKLESGYTFCYCEHSKPFKIEGQPNNQYKKVYYICLKYLLA